MAEKLTRSAIQSLALDLGFSSCRFTKAKLGEAVGNRLRDFVLQGYHGQMAWMEETLERRTSPERMWADAETAIVLGMNYGPQNDPLEILGQPDKGAISVYAQNRDYHDIIKGRLKQIAQKIAARTGAEVKVFVDTAPLMEKPLAEQAGVGWQGKHTNLVSREFGSWLFLGTILTSEDFELDEEETDHCGNCRACLDICPTNAFPGPYKLDARRCISYLTIEHDGPIPAEFRRPMGNRIYGCDDCLAVCPWNKFAQQSRQAKLQARDDLKAPDLKMLAGLDDAAFRNFFSGSPVKRIGRDRFVRNVLIAIGNSGNQNHVDDCISCLGEVSSLVRGSAVWALSQLMPFREFRQLATVHAFKETDPDVLEEWKSAVEAVKS